MQRVVSLKETTRWFLRKLGTYKALLYNELPSSFNHILSAKFFNTRKRISISKNYNLTAIILQIKSKKQWLQLLFKSSPI